MNPGKYRHLSRCALPNGRFVILAIDHRASLREQLSTDYGYPISDAEFSAFKQVLIDTLLPHASALLADPGFAIGPGLARGVISGRVGLFAPLERGDLLPSPADPIPLPDWDASKIKRMGADGAKLLLHYNPEAPHADAQRARVAQLIEACRRLDLPFCIEPIPSPIDPVQPFTPDEYTRCMLSTVQQFRQLKVDLLKLPFPSIAPLGDGGVWRDAAARIGQAAENTPWTLLSAGADYSTFVQQTIYACEYGGACGIIVGRAIWNEAIALRGKERIEFLREEGARRLNHLAELVQAHGRRWDNSVTPPNSEDFAWYQRYDPL